MGIFFLLIMQRLCRINLHGLTGRNADADGDNQCQHTYRNEEAAEESIRCYIHQRMNGEVAHLDIETDNQGRDGGHQ